MNEPFELLVKRMRDAQKRFFKVRGTDALELSWELEKEVDARIEEMTVGGDLFGGADTIPDTNFDALTGNRDKFAEWMAMHAMCDFCPARIGTCDRQTAHSFCRMNWRNFLKAKYIPNPEAGR